MLKETPATSMNALASRQVSRRTALGSIGVVGLGVAGGLALSGCGAPAAVVGGEAASEVVFNPAVDTWLADIAKAVLASEVTKVLDGGLSGIWRNWTSQISGKLPGNTWYEPTAYCHHVPPTVLIRINANQSMDPMTDHMFAAVQGGTQAIIFAPWAWQALAMYIQKLTDKRTGDDLVRYQQLAAEALLPALPPKSGASPRGTAAWLSYSARTGVVEMARLRNPDGTYTAEVTAYGIPNASHQPTAMKFVLPTKPA